MAGPFVPKEGELYLNRSLLRDPSVAADDWFLRCWKNVFTPGMDSVRADFVESDFAGYAPIFLDPALWLPPVLFNVFATSYYGVVPGVFVPTAGSQAVIGWMVTKEDDTVLWCEKLASAFTVTTSNPLALLPVWVASSFNQPP